MAASGTSDAGRSPRKRRGWRAICTESFSIGNGPWRSERDALEWRGGTHERPHALPVHVHRDGREPADGLARPEDEQRDLDAAGDDDAVGEEGRAVEDHVLREVRDGEDVQGVGAVRVQQVGYCRSAGDDHAEVEHAATQVHRAERRLDANHAGYEIRLERMRGGGAQSAERNEEESG